MRYRLTKEDFDTALDFGLRYHLDPKKSQASRTSGATRGLGGVLDSFLLGKLVEIGVARALETYAPEKTLELDFDIKNANDVINEPDVVSVMESGKKRRPNVFLEIKNISPDDRWVGLTQEQFDTLKKSSKPESIYIVGAYIENHNEGNSKQKDLLGVTLKEKFPSPLFDEFTSIQNMEIVIDFAISGQELELHGKAYKKESLMYETHVFELAGRVSESAIKNGNVPKIAHATNGILERYQINQATPDPVFMGDFVFKGEIEIFEKINAKSKKRFIKCISDVTVSNTLLGNFELKEGSTYLFNLTTMGRNPVLNRNNIWIAKRNIHYMQEKKSLRNTEENLQKIAEEI